MIALHAIEYLRRPKNQIIILTSNRNEHDFHVEASKINHTDEMTKQIKYGEAKTWIFAFVYYL